LSVSCRRAHCLPLHPPPPTGRFTTHHSPPILLRRWLAMVRPLSKLFCLS
jgi:hypothetical protein